MKTLNKVEIFAVGVWNGITVTSKILGELANNFTRLSDVIDVYAKLGHNEEQKVTDGQPALGWASKVWVEGEKLFATMTDVPDIVAEAIEKKLYKNVSIEALFDVEHKGVQYGTVLTAVALLGADMPAVNTLNDLKTYMTANNLAFTSHATFSKKPINTNHNSGGSTMTPEEQAEFDKLKATNKAQATLITEQAGKFTTQQAEIDKMKSDNATTAFTRDKADVEATIEKLVKDKKMLPAQRDKLMEDFTAETAEQIKFSISLFENNASTDMGGETSHDKSGEDKDKENFSASDRVDAEASKIVAANPKIPYGDAVQSVFSADPKLAEEYANENDVGA